MNPIVKLAGIFPIYSNKTPVRWRQGLGKVLKQVPLEKPTGKFNIKPIRGGRRLLVPPNNFWRLR